MEWEPQQQDLGGLGFAGICRETYRVQPHTIGSPGAAILSALLVAHPVAMNALLRAINGPVLVGLVACILFEMVWLCVLVYISLACTAEYVFRVASLYCTDGDSRAADRIFRDVPRAPLARFCWTFIHVVPLSYMFSVLACFVLLHLDKVAVGLPLRVLAGAACLAGAAYVSVVSHVACVVAVLEDAVLFSALRKSHALLTGKFWAAAAVFVPLDGCFAALQVSLLVLTLEDGMGLAAGAAMAVALWAVVVVTQVAQPVVYMVCKNHHHEVVDRVHLNYVGEYQRLAVDGNSGVELQPVETTPPTATSAQASPQPEVLPTPPAAPPAPKSSCTGNHKWRS